MKVRDQFVYRAELVRRAYEDARVAAPRRKRTVWTHDTLERAHRRRSDGPDAPSARASLVERHRGAFIQTVPLLVHHVVGGIVGLHRLEGPRAHVQQEVDSYDSVGLQRVEQIRCEMKAGGWSGYRSRLVRVHGLVSLRVDDTVAARDVRRQR